MSIESSPLEPFIAELDQIASAFVVQNDGHPLLPDLVRAYEELVSAALAVDHDTAASMVEDITARLRQGAAARTTD